MKALLFLFWSVSVFAAGPIGATYFKGAQISTPSTPGAGYNDLYFKSDNHLYELNSSGTETQVDATPFTKSTTFYNGAYFAAGTKIVTPATFNPGAGDWGVSFWFYWTGDAINYQNFVSPDAPGFSGDEGYCRVWGGAGRTGQIGCGTPAADPDLASIATVSPFVWTHVVFTRLSGTLKIYINGALDTSKVSGVTYNFSENGGPTIGNSRWDGPAGYFTGMIQEMQFYSAGLSGASVTALYNGGAGVYGTGSEPNLIDGYHLNGTPAAYGGTDDGVWTGNAFYATGIIQSGTGNFIYLNPALTAPPNNCGNLTGSLGCVKINLNGTTQYLPYW